jgi:hypothetical protein
VTLPSDVNDTKPDPPSDNISSPVRRGPANSHVPIASGKEALVAESDVVPQRDPHVYWGLFVSRTGTTVTAMRQDGLQVKATFFNVRASLEIGQVLTLIRTREPDVQGNHYMVSSAAPSSVGSPRWGMAYAAESVETTDATFEARLYESYPTPTADEEVITVVNPIILEGSVKHGYELDINANITVLEWTNDRWLIIDAPCKQDYSGTNPPTDISLSNASVPEESPGHTVGILSTTDADLPDDSHTYTILDLTTNFEINGTELKVKDDVELDSANSPDSVTIQTTDSAGFTFTKEFEITITSTTALGRFTLSQITSNLTTGVVALGYQQWPSNPRLSIPNNSSFSYESVEVSSGDTLSFLVKNRGDANLTASAVSVSGSLFSSVSPSTSQVIGSSSIETYVVTLLGGAVPSPGEYATGTIQWTHDGSEYGESSVYKCTFTLKYNSSAGPPP